MRISDWSSDVCSSDLGAGAGQEARIGPSPFRCTLSSDRVPCGRSAGSAWPLSSSVSAHISLTAKHQTETASSVIVQPLRRNRLRIERPLAAPLPESQQVAGIMHSGGARATHYSAVEGGA